MYQVNQITLQGASQLHSPSARIMMLNRWQQKRQVVTTNSTTSNKTAEDSVMKNQDGNLVAEIKDIFVKCEQKPDENVRGKAN